MAEAGQDHLYKKVQLAGPGIDPYSGALSFISEPHMLIHQGKMFHMTTKTPDIANTASVDFLMRVPAGVYPHLHVFRINVGGGDIDIVTHEGADITAPGTAIDTHNINRVSSNTPELLMYANPTVNTDGTEIHRIWIPPTANGQGNSSQGVSGADAGEEWIMAPSTDYLQRITNNSGSTIKAWVEMLWYEL